MNNDFTGVITFDTEEAQDLFAGFSKTELCEFITDLSKMELPNNPEGKIINCGVCQHISNRYFILEMNIHPKTPIVYEITTLLEVSVDEYLDKLSEALKSDNS